ncbi:hypothetical protein TSOC_001044 [Tetrabaena socialis]|uniref:Uncharacterized protein n=1 Tax=Tetrabaena socialis TaxID=47790 RepID=A0A2J8AHU8_9CHLO|nr:hypothetical protein TSOC_013592 [Tetrabaena socialis]PNH12090.1 hypothetical protein TSOC_001044 [Tetrabaena socialis]|eukprot:PNH00571.1 hypothetical protein TSOC_013592 [Tetrabaena socialis]
MERKAPAREKLDVPAVAPIEQKLANLTRQRPCIGPAPRSSVLGQLAAFLPQLALENERLRQQMQTRPAAEFDIEHVGEGDSEAPYIEMDLACGVLELRDEAALRAAERAMEVPGDFLAAGGEASSSAGSSSDDDSDEDGDDDTEGDDEDSGSGRGNDGVAGTRAREAGTAAASPRQGQGGDGMECDGGGPAASGGPGSGQPGKEMGSPGAAGGVGAEALNGEGEAGGGGGDGARRRVKVVKKSLVTMLP